MINLARKTILAGAGLTLLSVDKLKKLTEAMLEKGDMTETDARETLSGLIEKSEKAKKIIKENKSKIVNDVSSFWMYGVLSDEIEDKIEKIASMILQQCKIPQQKELDEIKERIKRLEDIL
ncbi:MAG: hypothetical protein PHN75_18250 [Syntrophales bacterium]|nr:hypothetical protein [Syntrophales bacterium]